MAKNEEQKAAAKREKMARKQRRAKGGRQGRTLGDFVKFTQRNKKKKKGGQ